MVNHERYKWPGVSGEIRGSWGQWYWMVAHHHVERHHGHAWTKRRALAKMYAAVARYIDDP